MKQLIAFHGDPAVKEKYLARIQAHREADELVRGATGQFGRGCAVWCTLNAYNHAAYEDQLGIPQSLARIEDGLFESLSEEEAMEWPARFLSAIVPGSDLSLVTARFMHWLLVDPIDGVVKFARSASTKKAIRDAAALYARNIAGEDVDKKTWRAAAVAAAADAAAYAAAADYAAAAAADYAAAAADAADAADADAADYAAVVRAQARSRQAAKLVELLKDAPMMEIV